MSSFVTEVATASTRADETEAAFPAEASTVTQLATAAAEDGTSHTVSNSDKSKSTLFDDIFDDGPELDEALTDDVDTRHRASFQHSSSNFAGDISDIPRLRSIHITSGYRDGIATGKMQSVQAGFDEGYSLGAVLGLKAGWILGVLEGLIAVSASRKQSERCRKVEDEKDAGRGYNRLRISMQGNIQGAKNGESTRKLSEAQALFLQSSPGTNRDQYDLSQLQALQVEARKGLATTELFGNEFFGEDGIWRFDVPSASGASGEEIAVGFEEIAAAHPTIKTWTNTVFQLMERIGITEDLIDQVRE